MKKVYQKVIDKDNGDCMQAVVASLFEKELEEVPEFIKFGDRYFSELRKYFQLNGYSLNGGWHSENYSRLMDTKFGCLKKESFVKSCLISKRNIKQCSGVNGFFLRVFYLPVIAL